MIIPMSHLIVSFESLGSYLVTGSRSWRWGNIIFKGKIIFKILYVNNHIYLIELARKLSHILVKHESTEYILAREDK